MPNTNQNKATRGSRRRSDYFAKMPRRTVWTRRGSWTPTYIHIQHRQPGIEIQHYGLDSGGNLVYAGVTRHERINRAVARQIHCTWMRWRREYDHIFTGKGLDYPAKHNAEVTHLVLFPVDDPQQAVTFRVAA